MRKEGDESEEDEEGRKAADDEVLSYRASGVYSRNFMAAQRGGDGFIKDERSSHSCRGEAARRGAGAGGEARHWRWRWRWECAGRWRRCACSRENGYGGGDGAAGERRRRGRR